SWRHDQYSDFGGTSNPRLGVNWGISDDLGLSVRGSWGQSFRAPNFQEIGGAPSLGIRGFGTQSDIFGNTGLTISCDATGRPPKGSAAEKLFNAGFPCNAQPAGLGVSGGARGITELGLRSYANTDQQRLGPEQSTNWSLGFDLAPAGFFRGFALHA